jgi:hypothetical protein
VCYSQDTMKTSYLIRYGTALVGAVVHLSICPTHAFTFSLQEQGGLTGFVNSGSGTVTINPLGADHWQVIVQDARIGNPIGAGLSLAYTEPEPVGGFTAYNNIQVLSVTPGTAIFDVLSDEISPYSTIVPNGVTFQIQNTDIQPIGLNFNDFADTVPEPGFATLILGGGALLLLKGGSVWRVSPTPGAKD